MNEAQTRLDKIDPKLRDAGWGIVPGSNILVEYTAEPSLSCTFVLDKFDRILSSVIDSHLGLRSKLIGYQSGSENRP